MPVVALTPRNTYDRMMGTVEEVRAREAYHRPRHEETRRSAAACAISGAGRRLSRPS